MTTLKLTFKSACIISILFGITFFSISCRRQIENPPNPNEEELITTLKIIFTDSAGIQAQATFQYRDVDGDGGLAPSIWDTIALKANTTYFAEILLLNETESPADTISNEVLEENKEHLFCFSVSGANCVVQRTDSDGTYEVGLQSKWQTGAISNGTANIVLKHQPDVKDGTCAPGETDVDVLFQLMVQ